MPKSLLSKPRKYTSVMSKAIKTITQEATFKEMTEIGFKTKTRGITDNNTSTIKKILISQIPKTKKNSNLARYRQSKSKFQNMG